MFEYYGLVLFMSEKVCDFCLQGTTFIVKSFIALCGVRDSGSDPTMNL